MRPRTFWFLVLTCLVAASPALPQFFGMSGESHGTSYTFTFTPQPEMAVITFMTGAPYSGRQVSSNVQTLADGTRLTRSSQLDTVTYRDSAGRTRRERPAFPSSLPGGKPPVSFTIVEVSDPVGGYSWLLDSVNRVAHRVPLKARPMPQRPQTPRTLARPPAKFPAPATRALPDGTTAQSEQLGLRTISGVVAEGHRTTTTYPAGSFMGNDRPVTRVIESWVHPETRVVLLMKNTSPQGDQTATMEDFSTFEPDPALFQVPPDYRIVDETGPFKIVSPSAENRDRKPGQ